MKLQKMQSNSSVHAMRYEGWKIEKFECTEQQAKDILKNDPFFDIECELLEDMPSWNSFKHPKVKVIETGEIKSANKNAMKYITTSKGSIVKVAQSYLY
jgi:hypothetical protein